MENQLEKILQFEGQDIKVITDKGVEMFNLANSAKVLGLTTYGNNGNLKIRWKTKGISEKLLKIKKCTDVHQQYLDEIDYILSEIEETDDRNSIYMSRYLTSRLAMECHSDKANKYKDWLSKLDEAYSKGELQSNNNALMQFGDMAQQMSIMANTMQQIGQAFNGMQTFVRDSIVAKDIQIDEMRSLIGMYSRNVSDLAKKLKQKVKEKYNKEHIWATSSEYITEKEKLFREFNVTSWESISLIRFGEVENYIKNIK